MRSPTKVAASPRNHMLAALPAEAQASLLGKLRLVSLPVRQSIYAPDRPIEAVYFVETGFVSLVANLDEGIQVEVGVIGREGMVGMPLVFGAETSFNEAFVQLSGSAFRMNADAFQQELGQNTALRTALFRYNEVLLAQISQTAACNGRHGLEQRLARWLLMAHDRGDGDDLPLTHEFLATMLGVHRPSVTITAGILQKAGLIRYSTGRITIVDRVGLEAASCQCYAAVRKRTAFLLGLSQG